MTPRKPRTPKQKATLTANWWLLLYYVFGIWFAVTLAPAFNNWGTGLLTFAALFCAGMFGYFRGRESAL